MIFGDPSLFQATMSLASALLFVMNIGEIFLVSGQFYWCVHCVSYICSADSAKMSYEQKEDAQGGLRKWGLPV